MNRATAVLAAAVALAGPTIVAAAPAEPAAPAVRIEPVTLEMADGSRLAAERGTLVVPADRTRAGGPSLELAFVRVPGAPGSRPVPTLYLEGGPGGAATGLLEGPHAAAVVAAFRTVGDLVLLDQRGTGDSTPRPTCPPVPPSPELAFVDGAAVLAGLREGVARCAAEWAERGLDVRSFNTREAADDLDDLRRALGAERMNLVAFSYGTHLALATMRRHPGSLERVVLVGTEGPDHTYKLPSTLDAQLRRLSTLAAEEPGLEGLPDLMTLLERALARLEHEPVTVTVRDRRADADVAVRVGRDGLLWILRLDVGDGNDFVVFPALLHGIAQGDLTLLGRYVEKRWGQGGRSLMPIATDCASGASPARRARIEAELPGSVFGELTNFPFPAVCGALGDPDLGDGFRSPLHAAVPTLLVSGTLDSNTPPFQGEEVAWGLTRATHLVVAHAGHEDLLPDPEVQRAVFDFLAGEEVAGRRIALPRPRFLSLEEARDFRP